MNNPTYPVKVYVHALIGLSLPALTVFGFTVPTFRGIFFSLPQYYFHIMELLYDL